MDYFLSSINYGFILIFGAVLSFLFAGINLRDVHNLRNCIIFIFILEAIQLVSYILIHDLELIYQLYPLLIHLPIVLYLVFVCKKKWILSVGVLLSAYLFTTPRRFICIAVSAICGGSDTAFYVTGIVITIPLIWLFHRLFSRVIVSLLSERDKTPLTFSVFLLVYYIFSYATSVFSDVFYSGNPVVSDFMLASTVVCYFIFCTIYYNASVKKYQSDMERKVLKMKSDRASEYIVRLTEAQQKAAVYRHDMRHHLNFIATCINDGRGEDALSYINETLLATDAQIVTAYCGNNTVNLILSSLVERGSSAGVSMGISAAVPEKIRVADIDLCVIIYNAVENAINAASSMNDRTHSFVDVLVSCRRNDKLYIQVRNSFSGVVEMDDGIPVSRVDGHGLGTRSIIMTTEKYGGMYAFSCEDNVFTTRVIL